MMALELIKSSMDHFHSLFPLVNAIRKLLNLPWSVNLQHNSCADWLAKYGVTDDVSF